VARGVFLHREDSRYDDLLAEPINSQVNDVGDVWKLANETWRPFPCSRNISHHHDRLAITFPSCSAAGTRYDILS
jgi:hypothetical protein